jgi:uncharacterized membrane protein/protein-disulfide isomerase
MIGCDGSSSCDEVLRSRWAAVGPLPVSGLAAGAYLAILLASLFIGPSTDASARRVAWTAMLVLVGAAFGCAVWFIVVQKWIIGGFCPFCMVTHIIGVVLAALVFWRAPKTFNDLAERTTGVNSLAVTTLPWVVPRRFLFVGFAFAGILAVCQVSFVPAVKSRGGESHQSTIAPDVRSVPLVGSPDASEIVSLMFDYKCSHCQKLHFMLDEVIRRYHGKLAIALCPTPLNTACNPYIPRDAEEFKDSCELSKVALAVWLARREAFPAFELWMFSMESGDRWRPRSLAAAREKAIELVGQSQFEVALSNAWVDLYLKSSVKLFGETGGRAIPKMVFGSRWVIPQPNDSDELITILDENLALPKPD